MHVENASKHTVVFWQKTQDEYGVPEPAIMVEWFNDIMAITQDGHVIHINYESRKVLAKLLSEDRRDPENR